MTVKAKAVPAIAKAGPVTINWAAGAALTLAVALPVMLPLMESVAVRVWLPAVTSVALKVPTPPASAASAGKVAAESLLEKATVPL